MLFSTLLWQNVNKDLNFPHFFHTFYASAKSTENFLVKWPGVKTDFKSSGNWRENRLCQSDRISETKMSPLKQFKGQTKPSRGRRRSKGYHQRSPRLKVIYSMFLTFSVDWEEVVNIYLLILREFDISDPDHKARIFRSWPSWTTEEDFAVWQRKSKSNDDQRSCFRNFMWSGLWNSMAFVLALLVLV